MPEQFDVSKAFHHDPVAHFFFAALAKSDDAYQQMMKDYKRGDPVEVCFTVNGVEFPFAASIKEVYKSFESQLNERAAKIAYETASLKGLESLQDTIRDADWQIRNKIEEVFGVSLRDD